MKNSISKVLKDSNFINANLHDLMENISFLIETIF